ncbi:hypothetical protein ACPOL_4838 [Acidisarcina polymorpha]|uniref:Uncharacterized protein n=1 Tax=Acidisarcina polymorpha TaxID=2211140 RepID=A0A2Z5G550_9BACT|nr:hypothetical protein ACPOL_4838 [Acidisarcina polymorpha]
MAACMYCSQAYPDSSGAFSPKSAEHGPNRHWISIAPGADIDVLGSVSDCAKVDQVSAAGSRR